MSHKPKQKSQNNKFSGRGKNRVNKDFFRTHKNVTKKTKMGKLLVQFDEHG